MHSTDEKKPAGSSNSTAGCTDALMVSVTANTGKTFANLAARIALVGLNLTRGSAADGALVYYAAHWGVNRALPDLKSAAQYLLQIGGAT